MESSDTIGIQRVIRHGGEAAKWVSRGVWSTRTNSVSACAWAREITCIEIDRMRRLVLAEFVSKSQSDTSTNQP